jgi:ATP-binding cassette subfamily B protein
MTTTAIKTEKRARKQGARELSPDVTLGKVYDWRIVKRLWLFTKPFKLLLFASLVSYPIASAFQMGQPYLVKVAIDQHLVPKKMEGFGLLIAAYIGFVVLEFMARFYQTLITQLLGQKVTKSMRMALFHQLQNVDIGFLEKNPVGRLMTRVTNDVESIAEMFSAGAVSILGDFFTLGGIILVMLSMSVRLTLYAFAVLPFLLAVVLVFRKYAREAFRLVRTHLARINGFLNEAISGMALIQVFRQEKKMMEEFEDVNGAYRDANFLSIRYDAMTYAIVEGVSTVAVALVLLFGFQLFEKGSAEIGLFVAFVDYLRRFFGPITELSTKYTILQSAMASAERCIDLLDEKRTVVDPSTPRPFGDFSKALEFENVSFSYGEAPVLHNLSFTVRRGEKVAIVGPTGAGKSTIVKMITRFYDPTAGAVMIDGTDIRQISCDALRSKLALVLQDAYLFDGTIKENVSFGTKNGDLKVLEKAAERTQALELIESLPEKWDTKVGERGGRFSSGERQLIAFARALAADPDILVLDEATSAVDPETEARIQKAVDALIADRTAVVIAHRLSTIRKVDRIIVLAHGRVVEEGSHDELLAKDGVYKNLYELQFADAVERPAA